MLEIILKITAYFAWVIRLMMYWRNGWRIRELDFFHRRSSLGKWFLDMTNYRPHRLIMLNETWYLWRLGNSKLWFPHCPGARHFLESFLLLLFQFSCSFHSFYIHINTLGFRRVTDNGAAYPECSTFTKLRYLFSNRLSSWWTILINLRSKCTFLCVL
jgi:hypothetical protein